MYGVVTMAKNFGARATANNFLNAQVVLKDYCLQMGLMATFDEATALNEVEKVLSELSTQVRVERYFEKILYFRVIGGPVWMHQLQLRKSELLSKFRSEFSSDVKDLRFFVGD